MPAISREIPEFCSKFSTCDCFSPPTPNPHPHPQQRVKALLGNQQAPSKAIRHADSSLRKMGET